MAMPSQVQQQLLRELAEQPDLADSVLAAVSSLNGNASVATAATSRPTGSTAAGRQAYLPSPSGTAAAAAATSAAAAAAARVPGLGGEVGAKAAISARQVHNILADCGVASVGLHGLVTLLRALAGGAAAAGTSRAGRTAADVAAPVDDVLGVLGLR